MTARARCWVHEDCLVDLELSIACGPNPPLMLPPDMEPIFSLRGDGHGSPVVYEAGLRNAWGWGTSGDEFGDGGAQRARNTLALPDEVLYSCDSPDDCVSLRT